MANRGIAGWVRAATDRRREDPIAYAALSDSIAVIGSHHEVSGVMPIAGNPRDLTIDADGSCLYATNYGGSVSVIDIAGIAVIPGACRARRVDTSNCQYLWIGIVFKLRRRSLWFTPRTARW